MTATPGQDDNGRRRVLSNDELAGAAWELEGMLGMRFNVVGQRLVLDRDQLVEWWDRPSTNREAILAGQQRSAPPPPAEDETERCPHNRLSRNDAHDPWYCHDCRRTLTPPAAVVETRVEWGVRSNRGVTEVSSWAVAASVVAHLEGSPYPAELVTHTITTYADGSFLTSPWQPADRTEGEHHA